MFIFWFIIQSHVVLKGHSDRSLSAIYIPSATHVHPSGQLAQLVRESDLFFRVKRQIKTALINVVAEHVKSRTSNAKQGNSESVVHNKPEYADVHCYVVLILYTSPYHIYKTILMAK